MKLFLQLKHWQILTLFILMAITCSKVMGDKFDILFIVIYVFCFIGWIYSIGKVANKLNRKSKVENYKENLWFALYFVTLVILMDSGADFQNSERLNGWVRFVLVVIAMVSMIKLIVFSSKSLVQYETQKNVSFSEYFYEFIMILFFPIGVFVLQPRLNKILK